MEARDERLNGILLGSSSRNQKDVVHEIIFLPSEGFHVRFRALAQCPVEGLNLIHIFLVLFFERDVR